VAITKDEVAGTAKDIAGKAQEAIGKLFGSGRQRHRQECLDKPLNMRP